MRKIFFLFLGIFTVFYCIYEVADFELLSKEEIMNSWAWKIFIFTDEGEIPTVEIPPKQT